MATPDIYALLMGDEPDAVKTAQAMAAKIRLGREAAMAGALGSPGAIGAMGKVAGGFAGDDQQDLARGAEARMRYGEDAKNRAHALKMAEIMARGQLAAERARIAADRPRPGATVLIQGPGGQYYAVDKRDPSAPPVPIPAPGGGDEGLTRGSPQDVQNLNKDLSFLNTMAMRLPTLEQFSRKKDIPGIGPVDSKLPAWATSRAGIQARQAATDVLNAMIYESTGKQINEAETLRQKMAKGFGVEATRDEFVEGVKALRTYVERASTNAVRSRPPGVISLAKEQGILQNLEPYLDMGGSAAPGSSSSGKIRVKLRMDIGNHKAGTTGAIPAGEFDPAKHEKL
jgi:hypothetical protein